MIPLALSLLAFVAIVMGIREAQRERRADLAYRNLLAFEIRRRGGGQALDTFPDATIPELRTLLLDYVHDPRE